MFCVIPLQVPGYMFVWVKKMFKLYDYEVLNFLVKVEEKFLVYQN